MIYLQPNQSNEVIVTLYERCSNVINPFFTWQLTDIDSKNQLVFTSDDHSYSTYYFNAFTVSVHSIAATATPYGLTNGNVYTNAGNYQYTVYEMVNPYDLNLNNAIGVVEVGLLNINGTYSNYVINTGNDNATIVVNKNLNFYDQ